MYVYPGAILDDQRRPGVVSNIRSSLSQADVNLRLASSGDMLWLVEMHDAWQGAQLCVPPNTQWKSKTKISNHFGAETEIFPEKLVKTMAADALTPYVARTSAAVVSTKYEKCVPVFYEGGLPPVPSGCWERVGYENASPSWKRPRAWYNGVFVQNTSLWNDRLYVTFVTVLSRQQRLRFLVGAALTHWHLGNLNEILDM